MDDLILTINKLQQFNNKYDLTELKLPQIVVVGSQSSGKSSVMERIIGHDILPKAAKVATRCPIILQLIHQENDESNDISAIFTDNNTRCNGEVEIAKQLQKRTNDIGNTAQGVSSQPIILQLFSHNLPTLTLIDLPGIIKNDGDLCPGSKEKIYELSKKYASQKNCIILAISAANVDLANSDSIAIAKQYDPEGTRSLNVITKLDLMDKGTTAHDFLGNALLKRSLGTICVVNRSQECVVNKKSIKVTNEEEIEFFKAQYSDIAGSHGVDVLVKRLVNRLDDAIRKNIPEIENVITSRMESLSLELKDADSGDEIYILHTEVTKFIEEYRKIVKGDREHYKAEITGGAKISVILYTNFEKEIKDLIVKKISKERISTLIKNTTGNKRMSYSIEKPFIELIRDEIEQYKNPSIRCNDYVRDLLRDFVGEILNDFNFRKYKVLSAAIESNMNAFIEEKYKLTKEIIENIIRSEKEDIFILRPNNNTYNTLKDRIDIKADAIKKKAFDKIITTVTMAGTALLPPNLRLLLYVANCSGALGILKDAASGFTKDQSQVRGPPAQIRNQPQPVPQHLNNMINKVTDSKDERLEIMDYISTRADFPGLVGSVMDKIKQNNPGGEDEEFDNDAKVLKAMVKEYFEDVRLNVICNVPKWIQTVFVKDLLDHLDGALFSIRKEKVSELLSIDPKEQERIQMKKDEMKELKLISEELKKIKIYQL